MVVLFNQFKGARKHFTSASARCKVQPIDRFADGVHWTIDRWWSKDELVSLGEGSPLVIDTRQDFAERVRSSAQKMDELLKACESITLPSKFVSLAVGQLFDLEVKTNRSFFTKEFVNKHKGLIPVYSASKNEDEVGYGHIADNIDGIKYFSDVLTWNIDGSVGKAFFRRGRFTLSEKVIPLILRPEWAGKLDYNYLKHAIEKKSLEAGFSFSNKAGKSRIRDILIDIPADAAGEIDLASQTRIADGYERIAAIKRQLGEYVDDVLNVGIDFR